MSHHPSQSAFDELLVLAWVSGSKSAGDRLVERWHRRLWAHARVLTDCRDDASDAVQAAWADIARGRSAIRDPACFGVWAYRIVTRRCADQIRRKRTDRARAGGTDIGRRGETDGVACCVEAEFDTHERHAALGRALALLPRDDHAMLRLVHVDGLSVRRAAEVFEIPVGTVKSRLHTTRARLRAALIQGDGS